MINTRNNNSSARPIPPRKNNASLCSQKDLLDNV